MEVYQADRYRCLALLVSSCREIPVRFPLGSTCAPFFILLTTGCKIMQIQLTISRFNCIKLHFLAWLLGINAL